MNQKYCKNLWLCLHFQQLPVEIFTRESTNKPVVVTARQRIVHMNQVASASGIRIGSSVDTAYILAGDLVCFERNEEKELETLQHLGQWAYQFTPNVSVKAPSSLLLDIKSSLKLFDGIENIKTNINQGLQRLGYSAMLGVHQTPLAALLTAKTATTKKVTVKTALTETPVDKLDIDQHIIEGLQRMGVHCLEDILDLPQSGLARRFGALLVDYLQRLMGEKADPQQLISEQPDFSSEITFLSDVTNLESLVFPMRRLLQELSDFLVARQIKVNHFTFKLSHREHSPKSFSIYLAEPESDAAMFLLLSQLHLDKIHDVQEIDSLTLSADRFFSATSLSGDLFHGTRFQQKDGRMTGLADRENNNRFFNILRARLGPDACFGLAEANDHRPEKAWKVVSQSMQSKRKESSSGENPRPMFLLPKPRRLRLHDGQPWFNGSLRLLQGPERIDYGWWDCNVCRDYFVAKHTTGGFYWIFQEQNHHQRQRQWFLHGIFS